MDGQLRAPQGLGRGLGLGNDHGPAGRRELGRADTSDTPGSVPTYHFDDVGQLALPGPFSPATALPARRELALPLRLLLLPAREGGTWRATGERTGYWRGGKAISPGSRFSFVCC